MEFNHFIKQLIYLGGPILHGLAHIQQLGQSVAGDSPWS